MTEITYSIATHNDLKSSTALFEQTIRKTASKDYSPQEINSWAAGAKNTDNWFKRIDTHYFLLAKTENEVAGMASLDKNGYLDVLYVHPDHQGKGLASTLLTKMERRAWEDGHKYITSDISRTAKSFILRKGYEIVKPQLILCRGVVLRNYHVRKKLSMQSD